jgi:hypothetical protein
MGRVAATETMSIEEPLLDGGGGMFEATPIC